MNNPLNDTKKELNLLKSWLVVFIAGLCLYIATLAPDLVWQDQGDYQVQVAKMSLNRPGDVVRVHPLFIVTAHFVGKILPVSYAYAANLVSAIFGAATIANVFIIVYMLTSAAFPAVLSAAMLAFSHSHWFLSVQSQTYSMANTAFTAGLILYLVYTATRKKEMLCLMGLTFGLGISAHMMSQVGFFVIMLFLLRDLFKKEISVLDFILVLTCWAVGAFLLWLVIWIEYQRTSELGATLLSAVYGKWGKAVFNLGKMASLIKKSILFFVLNFPTPLALLSVVGLWLSFKRLALNKIAILLASMTVLYVIFAIRYDVPNQNNFFIPFYILVSIYAGLGFSFVFKPKKVNCGIAAILILCILPAYPAISAFSEKKQVMLGTRRHIPYRNVYNYYLIPWQQSQTGPRRLVTETFGLLPENAVLFVDSTVSPAFDYSQQFESARPDIAIVGMLEKSELKQEWYKYRWFTVCNAKKYYPDWVDQGYRLEKFPISESESIFEILPID